MKKLKTSQIILSLVIFTGALTIVGNGCSRFISSPDSSSSGNNSAQEAPLPETGGNGDIPVIPGTKTISFIRASDALDHFTVCSGLSQPSDTTVATYLDKKGAMSTTGQVNTLTAASLMAVTTMVGEICDDLIDQDIASPRLFVGFNFSSNSRPSDQNISDAVSRLAISCWSRRPDNDEASSLLNMVKSSIGSTETNGQRKAALLACTTVLSSLDALLE